MKSPIEPENVVQKFEPRLEPENVVQKFEPQFSNEQKDSQDIDIAEQGSQNPDLPTDNDLLTLVDNPNETLVDIENRQKQEKVVKA
jgi:hypothetical protein